MSIEILFLLGIGTTLAIAFGVVVYLMHPLRKILLDICGTKERAEFWTAFSNVTLVLVPLICALFRGPQEPPLPLVLELGAQVKWALIGLVSAVAILGFVLSWFIMGEAFSRPRAQAQSADGSVKAG